MGIGKKFYKDGFYCDVNLSKGDVIKMPAAAVNIVKGQALFDDTNGYATNTGTAFAATFLGVALSDCNNSAGASGALEVEVILPNPTLTFWVKVEANALVTQTIVGTIIDLEQNDSVDLSDTSTTAWGFRVDEIDASADAVAVNTYGYVKGRFTTV